MTAFLFVLFITTSTCGWFVNRWAMRHGSRPQVLGVVGSAVAASSALAWALARGEGLRAPTGWMLGAAGGVAMAVGYYLVLFYCLKIGPVGPTATVCSLGLAWPVAVSLAVFSDWRDTAPSTFVGLGAVLAALVLIGLQKPPQRQDATRADVIVVTPRWARWAILAWVLMGAVMTTQFLSSHYAPRDPMPWVIGVNATSFVILTAVCLAQSARRPGGGEWFAGAFAGVANIVCMTALLILLTRAPAERVFPITVATPMILVLLIARVVYHERLGWAGWAGCLLGAAGLYLLSASSPAGD